MPHLRTRRLRSLRGGSRFSPFHVDAALLLHATGQQQSLGLRGFVRDGSCVFWDGEVFMEHRVGRLLFDIIRCFSINFTDSSGDNYVHRLVQNKSDGKLIEVDESGNVVQEGIALILHW